ncbi:serine/threonine-protein kinase Nek4 isoform X2 [Nilaparvata lugens]|uniref:serine/threonine-protein kinase Nek4 isoform X2 n=1 Tax=Nilaparvata lugens TaxID=108931 RepID=UPI00193CFED1|nr:serine/threonine-protein kinase Nek4 isoform X2 [Nilaparvata lugens]
MMYSKPMTILSSLWSSSAPGGDMQTIIDNNVVPFEADVVRFVQHVVEGLAYLHHRRIAHLDIKPQNLVLMGEFPHCDVKVCDFEISRVILDGSDIHEILGTPEYVAPEILHYEPITLAADMWSLGVTVYVLLTGFSPFGGETDQETFLNISRAQLDFPDELFDDVSQHAKDFIAKLLKRNPKDRMTAKQCLNHPWLANNKTSRRHHRSKTTTNSHHSSGPTAATSSNQLRKYLSKSREALFERVVAKHKSQASSGSGIKSRYDRTRRLCESQMSLVSRSREQLLLSGHKRCLSRDKLYGIRHLSKSHEVLNSLAGALVAQQMDNDDGEDTKMAAEGDKMATDSCHDKVAPEVGHKDVITSKPSPLQTVLTLICDASQNNNNNDKERTKENGSTSSATKTTQSKQYATSSTPATPESTESKVLIAIEKLHLAMNNEKNNNNQNKDNCRIHSDENKTTTKTANQRKTSTTDDPEKTINRTADQRKISTTDDPNKTTSRSADQNINQTTADHGRRFTVSRADDQSRSSQIESSGSKRFTVSKTVEQGQVSSTMLTDQNKTLGSPTKTKMPSLDSSNHAKTAEQTKFQSSTVDKTKISTLSTATDHNRTSPVTDRKKMSSASSTLADKSKSQPTTAGDPFKTDVDHSKLVGNKTADQSKATMVDKTVDTSTTAADQSKMEVDQSKMTPDSRLQVTKRPTQLLFSKQTSGPGEDQNPSPLSPSTDLSSSEADVSEPDSSSHQSTWQRIIADEEEPRFTVAQLVSAFNKHQALVTKTSLEVTMNMRGSAPESKILPEEVCSHTTNRKFPIGPDALRLFIPGIRISEHNLKKSPPPTPPLSETCDKNHPSKPTEMEAKKSPSTPPPTENIDKNLTTFDKNLVPTTKPSESDQSIDRNRENQRKISDKSCKITEKPTVDCSSASTGFEFSPPTPPALPSSETRNYKEFSRPTTRHRTSGRQATTLAASSKIRKKSNTTPKPPPFY